MEKNPQSDLVQPNERIDDLQNGFYVIQNPEKFCFGMDAVLLSGFANIRKNETVLDMGTGTGIIPILSINISVMTVQAFNLRNGAFRMEKNCFSNGKTGVCSLRICI